MEYRKLGRSGLRVSKLCLGTMMFGDQTDEAESARIISAAADIGVNFLDCADIYGNGQSEVITGKAIKANRDKWVVASKVGQTWDSSVPNARGLSRRWVIEGTEGCLKRLGTDYLDILCLHREDRETPLDETMRAVADLVKAGKVRYVGISNIRPWRAALVCGLCEELGIDLPVMLQPQYNLVNRTAEYDLIPMALHYGIGVVPFSPLARGVLTGKYKPGEAPAPDSRAGRKDGRMLITEWREESIQIAHDINAYAAQRSITMPTLAINWILANKSVSSVIAGPRTLEQWKGYADALDYSFTKEDEAFLSGLVAAGHTSTPGYIDPVYPVEGRVVNIAA
jgi:aryl-alcohol dehydrogenase (NADP+)